VVNERLVDRLVRGFATSGVESFADVYCGAGNFALPLMLEGSTGAGVEWDPHASDALRRSASELGLDAANFVAGDAHDWMCDQAARGRRFDAVIVDPPRAGLGDAARAATAIARRYVVLLSCHLPAFFRDAAQITARGFSLEELWAVDMFPNTRHVEVVSWFVRTSSSG
jgi:23S rRNA (uracil1939-C5)-methyltransferase